MGTKKYNATTPGRRHGNVLTFEEITKKKPEKSLMKPLEVKVEGVCRS